jgi:class 3 adenylate cyclase/tetratricopeptide (TPR) repeat protein
MMNRGGKGTAMRCSGCGHVNPNGQKFCGQCGAPLGGDTYINDDEEPHPYTPEYLVEKVLKTRSALEGERKRVTVLFCDIADSTGLAERLGPERMHAVLNAFFEAALAEVHRYEGTVNQFLGDGFMALFGAPISHEDHARRAVLAALAVRQALASEGFAARDAGLRLRMGLNSGAVVVGRIGDGLRMDYTAVGDTTNVAARLQGQAEPGSILVSDSVWRATQAYAQFTALGERILKGKGAAVPVYELLTAHLAQRRPATDENRPALVGRENEVAVIEAAIEHLQAERRGGVLGLMGDAGLGKSRLLEEARRLALGRRLRWLQGDCLSFGRTLSYWPFREVIRGSFAIDESDDEAACWRKIEAGMQALFAEQADELLPYIGTLLAIALPEPLAQRVNALDSLAIGHQIFRATLLMCEHTARRSPLVLAFEDWHWADASSADLLLHLLPLSARVPILFVVASRPEPQGPAESFRMATSAQADPPLLNALSLRIAPLQAGDSVQLADRLVGGGALPTAVRDMLLRRSEGNPFYLRELVHALLGMHAIERDAQSGGWRTTSAFGTVPLPDTIEGLILARIDRLEDEAKQVLKAAAVVGRTFSYRVLEAVTEAGTALEQDLVKLRGAQLIGEKQLMPELEYVFKHPLIQQATYDSLLEERRRQMHARVGRCIEQLFEGRLEPFYSMLAYHYAKADDSDKAQEYLFKAGDQAGGIAADLEALEHYRAAVLILKRSPSPWVDPLKQAELDWRIGEALFRLGRYDDSLRHLMAALEALGVRYPSQGRAVALAIGRRLLAMGWRRLVRGLKSSSSDAASAQRPVGLSAVAVIEAIGNIDFHRDPRRFVLDILTMHEHAECFAQSQAYVLSSAALGLTCDMVGLYRLAERLHAKAFGIAQALGDDKALGHAYFLGGLHAYSTGRFALARDKLSAAIDRFKVSGDLRQWAGAMSSRMFLLRAMGDPQWIKDVDAMLDMAAVSQDDHAMAWSLGWAAERHLVAGDLASATTQRERSSAMARSLGDYRTEVINLSSQAISFVRQGNMDRALLLLEDFYALLDKHRIVGVFVSHAIVQAAEAYLLAAESETRPSQRKAFLALAKRACARATRHGRQVHDDSAAEALRVSGIHAWLTGNPTEATRLWRKGLNLAQQIPANGSLSKIHFEIGLRLGDAAHMSKARSLSGFSTDSRAARRRPGS